MASSSIPNSTQERDTHMLSVGRQCSDPTCYMVDFLPFKCHHCQLSFCQDHYKVDAHKCANYDERKHNRIAPSCPLCNSPITVPTGQDPNVVMDSHLDNECSIVTGKVKAKTLPTCERRSCHKVLFTPVRCDKCRKQFCPSHRFPADHSCSPAPALAPKSNVSTSFTAFNANINAGAKNLNTRAAAASSAAANAVKKSIANVSIPANSAQAAPSAPPKPLLPFSKMDRSSAAPSSIDLHAGAKRVSPADSTTIPVNSSTTASALDDHIIKPSHIIDPMSFVPRSIFASA
ncbi:hypothetical protein CPC08DRAFT_704429 [Agrocybe pediades]|nr:hypothetical protein CPC08DRAFT_704429 [Agrocybe pediades]